MDPLRRAQSKVLREEDWSGSGGTPECRCTPEAPRATSASAITSEPNEGAEASTAVRSLVETFREPSDLDVLNEYLPAGTNAGRTSERNSSESYVAAGQTRNGDWFAGAAALKTRDPATGFEAEVFTGSVQAGSQSELQAGLSRMSFSAGRDLSLSTTFEAFTARANGGELNDDGSRGANLGIGAAAVGAEATVSYSGWSLTAGAAVSLGFSVSSGERDADGDGSLERCFKGSIGFATLGVCTEL
ncbi:MAG TPA: hypothetical protein VIM73_20870 [Polyangiaceae bacterium]